MTVSPDVEAPTVGDVIERALSGERIFEEDALALLRSRELVPIGRAADALRARRTDPSS
jgi:2-iminoacetate synthase ThiH